MKKIDWKHTFDSLASSFRRHSPEILTGLGIAGMITTTVLAVKATPSAMKKIEEKKKTEHHKKLTMAQTVQAAGPCYVPAAVTGAASIACLIGANTVNGRRNAALATAYSLAENSLRDYQDYRAKVVETLGEEKDREIHREIQEERAKEDPPVQQETPIMIAGKQYQTCRNTSFGGYFYATAGMIDAAVNEANRTMNYENYISLNGFYEKLIDAGAIGVEFPDLGEQLGWNIEKDLIRVDIDSVLLDRQTPILTLTFRNPPYYDFDICR